MRRYIIFLFTLITLTMQAQPQTRIIPKPSTIEWRGEGYEPFVLNEKTKVYFPETEGWGLPAQAFQELVRQAFGHRLTGHTYTDMPPNLPQNALFFAKNEGISSAEGYKLDVSPSVITIEAATPQGAFYGLQTLRQLFPPSINALEKVGDEVVCAAPACHIEDAPRFPYRGMHLDVGRHFFPVDFIKKYIDLLAFHKLNRFHWHLTEDQGWRIEIPDYPKLQTVAACRKETVIGHYRDQPRRYDGKEYCGYYTTDEVREVIDYAAKRFVTIVPEIEMPGHSQAVLSAYPELGCTGGPYEAATLWGIFDEVYCAGNDQTFEFLENVLAHVAQLFPGEFIHIGGDECPKSRWEHCPKCQKRIADEGLKNEHELQSYFIKRMEKVLAKHGKKLIGWDEILEGGLAPNAAVMSWRGTEGGIAAAQAGHDVVMTPTSHCYFDYYQAPPEVEPLAIGGFLTVEKVYGYEPMPEELAPERQKHILGVQGNVWTEYMPTARKVEYMAFPRACALSEIAWVQPEAKDYEDFAKRLQAHFADLDALDVNYSEAFYYVTMKVRKGKIRLRANDPGLVVRYTLDGSVPTAKSAAYSEPIIFDKTLKISALAFKNDEPVGKVISRKLYHHKARKSEYTLNVKPEEYKGDSEFPLTDGALGSVQNWADWVGTEEALFAPALDFSEQKEIKKITVNTLDAKGSWIWGAKKVEVFVSENGTDFRSVGVLDFDPLKNEKDAAVPAVFEFSKPLNTRYLKVEVHNFGKIPEGYNGAGHKAWLFVDEVVVE